MNNIRYLRDYLADMYIEIESNSFTVEIFSEYYGLDEEDAKQLLILAKKCHEQRLDFIKDTQEIPHHFKCPAIDGFGCRCNELEGETK